MPIRLRLPPYDSSLRISKAFFPSRIKYLIAFSLCVGNKPQVGKIPNICLKDKILSSLVILQMMKKRTYNENIKSISLYIFLLGGGLLHKLNYIVLNLPLPSFTVFKYFNEDGHIIEADFRIQLLNSYLIKNFLPLKVRACEDCTRLTPKLGYLSSTDTIVGLVLPLTKHGIPIC